MQQNQSHHQAQDSISGGNGQGSTHQLIMNKTTSFLGGAVGMANSMNAQSSKNSNQRDNFISNQSHREFGRDITTAA